MSYYPNFFIDILLTISKVIIYILIMYHTSIIKGFIISQLVIYTYHTVLEKLTNCKLVYGTNKLFIKYFKNDHTNVMTLIGLIEVENYNYYKLKNFFSNIIKEVPKLNSRLIYKYGNIFIENLKPTQDRLDDILYEVKDHKFVDYNDVVLNKVHLEVEKPLDLSDRVFELQFIKYKDYSSKNKKGCILLKIDHSCSDGMHIMSLLMCIADNFSMKLFPSAYNRYNNSYLYKFVNLIYTIFIGSLIATILIAKTSNNNYINRMIPSQNNKADMSDINNQGKYGIPVEFNLTEFKKLAKNKLNITINELAICLILLTIKRISKESKSITIAIPVGNTQTSKELKNIKLTNNASGVSCCFDLISSLKESKKVSNKLKYLISKKYLCDLSYYCMKLFSDLLPSYYNKVFFEKLNSKTDIIVSNLPGPIEPLYYSGCKITRLNPFSTCGLAKGFITIMSYNNKIYINSNFQKTQNNNPMEFNNTLLDIYKEEVNKLTLTN